MLNHRAIPMGTIFPEAAMKPFKGEIHYWYKHHFDVEANRGHIPEQTLGFIVYGHRHGKQFMHTSPVISHDDKTGEIETLNSRYTLIGPEQQEADYARQIRSGNTQ